MVNVLLWHPSLTAINLSYTFPILETSATALCGTTGITSITSLTRTTTSSAWSTCKRHQRNGPLSDWLNYTGHCPADVSRFAQSSYEITVGLGCQVWLCITHGKRTWVKWEKKHKCSLQKRNETTKAKRLCATHLLTQPFREQLNHFQVTIPLFSLRNTKDAVFPQVGREFINLNPQPHAFGPSVASASSSCVSSATSWRNIWSRSRSLRW